MLLHPKVLELRNSIDSSPIKTARQVYTLDEERSAKVVDDRVIKQYFAIWGVPDDYGTVPVKGCFQKSLNERGPKSKGAYKIPVLWQHDQKDPLCLPTTLVEDEVGLYGEYTPDPIPSGDRCVIQVRSGTVNNGSYGFHHVWDKLEYDDSTGLIMMNEVELFEVSPVTIGSQKETYVKRSAKGEMIDEFLDEETEDLIKMLPRKHHLEIRSLISRHISLAKAQPLEQRQTALGNSEPKHEGIDYNYLIKNLF